MAQMVVTAGIDVSKPGLDVETYPTRQQISVSRDMPGLASLIAWLSEHDVLRVGLEASGGYERLVIDTLQDAGFEVVLLNALRVRRFAEAKGRLAKNDRVDARTIAQFTAFMVEQAPTPRRRDLDPLVELLGMRRQLKRWSTDCTQQLEHLHDGGLRKLIKQRQASFEREVVKLDARIDALLNAHDDWQALARRLRTVPGVGRVVATTLIALLPELGRLSRRMIASLAGLAPYDDDSGKRRGERHIKGGRATVREALYMAALVAMTHNPLIAAFARRLHGKKPKVIITACMRKLLVMLNAMLRDGTDWRLATA
jgi:transposase